MKFYHYITLLVTISVIISCGKDPLVEGKKAFEQKNYIQALNQFKQLNARQIEDPQNREMMALAYMYRGKEFFERTKNIKSFAGNYKKAELLKPENPTPAFLQEYSQLVYNLAESYLQVRPENEIKKEEYMNSAFAAINYVLQMDSTNTAARDLMNLTLKNNFESLLKKAEDTYAKAKKLDQIDLLFIANSHLQKASEYDANDQRVKKLERKLRRSMLPILDHDDGLALAVTETLRSDENLKIVLAVENYLSKPVHIKPDNFYLVDYKGRKYGLDKKEMQFVEYSAEKTLKPAKLDHKNPYIDGVLAFDIPKGTAVSYLVYLVNEEELARKYFR